MKRFYQIVGICGFILVILSVLPLFAFWREFENSMAGSFNSTIIMSTAVLVLEIALYAGFIALSLKNKNRLLFYSAILLIFFSLCDFGLIFLSNVINEGRLVYVISQTTNFSMAILIALVGFALMDFVDKIGSSALVSGILYIITGVIFLVLGILPGLANDQITKFFFMLAKLTLSVLTNVFVGVFFLYIATKKKLYK